MAYEPLDAPTDAVSAEVARDFAARYLEALNAQLTGRLDHAPSLTGPELASTEIGSTFPTRLLERAPRFLPKRSALGKSIEAPSAANVVGSAGPCFARGPGRVPRGVELRLPPKAVFPALDATPVARSARNWP